MEARPARSRERCLPAPNQMRWLGRGGVSNIPRRSSVPPSEPSLMIARLRTAVPSSDEYLAEALEKLTGEKLGKDADAWQKWLDENRPKLPEQLR